MYVSFLEMVLVCDEMSNHLEAIDRSLALNPLQALVYKNTKIQLYWLYNSYSNTLYTLGKPKLFLDNKITITPASIATIISNVFFS